MAIGVGVLLWFVPTLLLPVLGDPIAQLLRDMGLLAASAGEAEGNFTAALVLRWVAVVLLIAFVIGVERLPLRSVGMRKPKWVDLFWAVGGGLFSAIAAMALHLLFQGPNLDAQTQTGQIVSSLPFLGRIHLILNAATVEELFFRGFLIERVTTLTQRAWLAGTISFVLFVVSHLSGSGLILTLTTVAAGTLIIVLIYLRRRNLFTCIGVHTIGDLPLLLA